MNQPERHNYNLLEILDMTNTECSDIRLRLMKESDREAVLEMMRVFYTSEAVLSNGSEEIYNNDITECVSDSPYANGYVFVDHQNTVRGYAMIAFSFSTEFGKPCIWIEDLYLGEEIRGKGCASLFFNSIITDYPDHIFRLEAENENAHAMDVYLSKGFRELPYVEMIRNNKR